MKANSNFTEREIAKIRSDYQSGMSLRETAISNNTSAYFAKQCLDGILKKRNLKRETWKDEIVDRYMNGEVCNEMAKEYGIDVKAIFYYLKSVGATDEKRKRVLESYQPILADYNNGMMPEELLSKYPQFSKNNIRHIVSKFGDKKKPEVDEEIIIENLQKAKPKEKIRTVKAVVNKKVHVYQDIFDMVAGV